MAVGAKDKIDRKLVQMYANVQTNNYDKTTRVDPERIMDSMSLIALNNRNFVQVRNYNMTRKADLPNA
jgi:hypothetical protein